MREYSTLAAVDLGSNSFHLQVARVMNGQLYPLDSLKETVQLAAGLSPDQNLDEPSQSRALACLKRFSEHLHGFSRHTVRVVGTNSLRVARNAAVFLKKAESTLGFPVEIITGYEEARLIYLGVAHNLPTSDSNRLVVDIGGGSTELIIGNRLEPQKLKSLRIGCINYSQRYFPDGKITEGALERSRLAARTEIQAISTEFSCAHHQEAYGSSGTALALARILTLNGYNGSSNEEMITAKGLEKLRESLLMAGDTRKLEIAGLYANRKSIIAGGFCIMAATFSELDIDRMAVTTGALCQGVLYDTLGHFRRKNIQGNICAKAHAILPD